jgi:DNA-binding response OmpR family regulator
VSVSLVTRPFRFEGTRRGKQADDGIEALSAEVDTLIVVPNEQLLNVLAKTTTMVEAFQVADDVLRLDDLEIDLRSRRARRGGKEVRLSATETRLLSEMARRPGLALSRHVLLDRVWGYRYLGDSRLVDMAIRRLRAKVEDDPHNPRLIRTVRGVGYQLDT